MIRKLEIIIPAIILCAGMQSCSRSEKMVAPGSIEWDRVSILSEISEPVTSVNVIEGEQVKAGQVLLVLDTRRTEAELKVAQAQLVQAQNNAIAATRDQKRAASLRSSKTISQQMFDNADTNERVALATLQSAQANVERMQLTLQRLEVRAPRDGRVDSLPYRKGDQPPPGVALVSLLVGEAPYARVYIPEPFRARIQPGAHMRVTVDGIEKPFDAVIRSIRSEPGFTPYYALTGEDASRLSYRAELLLSGDDASKLPPGVPCHAEMSDESGK